MTVFQETVYTPEALDEEIQTLQALAPSTRVVGSLGRSVLFNQFMGDPYYEFNAREQSPLRVGDKPRDIDIVGLPVKANLEAGPYTVDAFCFLNRFVSLVPDGTDWVLVSEKHKFAEIIKPETMEPVSGESVFGIRTSTVPPQTMLALYGVKGALRAKDIKTSEMLSGLISSQPSSRLFPEEFLEPFRVVTAMNLNDFYIKAQDLYRKKVPNSIRVKAVPMMKFAKKYLG